MSFLVLSLEGMSSHSYQAAQALSGKELNML